MATPITMPKLGLTMKRGKVVKWLKQDGQPVEMGELLVVIMSKKVTYEMEAPASGTVRILTPAKGTQEVAEPIGYVLEPGESLPTRPTQPRQGAAIGQASEAAGRGPAEQPPRRLTGSQKPPVEMRSSPAARRLAQELGLEMAEIAGAMEGEGPITESDVRAFHRTAQARSREEHQLGEIRSSPAARRLARELGLEMTEVARRMEGEGPITERDVRAAVAAGVQGGPTSVSATPLARRMAEEEGLDLSEIVGSGPSGKITEEDVLQALEIPADATTIPFAGVRETIAQRMMESLHATAQLTLTARADVTEMVSLREELRERWKEPVGYNDLVIKAAALALREHPRLNSTLSGDEIVLLPEVDIGVAVALEDGLIVPVIRGADEKGVLAIHREVRDLARRAREGTLSVDQVTGGTFTLTNLGAHGVDAFTPILNQPQVAILGVGQIAREPGLVGEKIVPRWRVTLSLTIDHRVVDGAPGAAYLGTVVRLLEHPGLIFAPHPGSTSAGSGG